MKVAILGPGAVGGFLAALFWKNNIIVECIAKPETVAVIKKNGLVIKSKIFGNFTAWPSAAEKLTAPTDIIFITVKANFIKEALKRLDPALSQNSIIIPLLNGLAHINILKSNYGVNAIAGTIGALEVFQDDAGVINHISTGGKIEIASDNQKIKARLNEVKDLISKIGLGVEILNTEAQVIWHKLIRLNAIACATAATDKPIGVLRTDPIWRPKIQAAVSEAVAVAKREGAVMDTQEIMNQIDKVQPEQLSSLQRDVSQGKPSEVEAIPGAIVEKCAAYKLKCPIISELYQLIKAR